MGAIGRKTLVGRLDLGSESVRRELVAILPSISRVPLSLGGLPTARWFEQFDEEEINDPLTVEDLLAKVTFSVTYGHELQVHAGRDRWLDREDRDPPGRALLVIELRSDNWVVPVRLGDPRDVHEVEAGQLATEVDPSLDVGRWGARPRTRAWLRHVYLEWHLDRGLEMPVTLEGLRRELAWEGRLEALFPVDPAEVPRPADLAAPDGPERWAARRWEAVTGERLQTFGLPRWPAGVEEEERELLIGALADYARGLAAASATAA